MLWLTDTKGRRSASPPTRSPTSRSPATPGSQGRLRQPVAARVIGPGARPARPAPALLHGKGGVGKSTMAAATALLAANIGKRVLLIEVDAKGDVPAQFEQRPGRLRAARGASRRARDGDGHRGVAAGVPASSTCACRSSAGSARSPSVLDFVATAAPGVKEILTDRQDLLGGARGDRGPRRASTSSSSTRAATGHIVAQLGAADAIQELVDVGPVREQTQWVARAARRSRDHRGQRRDDARGDAGRGDDRARRAAARRGRGAARRGDRQPGAARAVHPRRRGDVRGAARARRGRRCSRARAGAGADRGARRGAARGVAAAHARRAPRRAARRRSTSRCSTCRTCSCATTACASRAWSPTRSARSSACDRGRPAPRSSSCFADEGDRGVLRLGRRRQDVGRGRRRARRGDAGSAARCSCSPSTPPGGSRPRSASTASATRRTGFRPRC